MSDDPPDPTAEESATAFGAAAHEIKNALGPLAMTLQLAERQAQAGQPVAPAELAFARAQVRRIARLVEDLMDLTRVDLNQMAIRPVAGDLCAVVDEAVQIFRRGHAVEVTLALPAAPVRAAVDPARVQQVLLNLLENAVRYSPAGAPVAVAVGPGGPDTARVTVTDRGRGVLPDQRQRIFERFVRGDGAEGTNGLGLGLYLCRSIVDRHGGTIGVDSAPGVGATFWFDLPVET